MYTLKCNCNKHSNFIHSKQIQLFFLTKNVFTHHTRMFHGYLRIHNGYKLSGWVALIRPILLSIQTELDVCDSSLVNIFLKWTFNLAREWTEENISNYYSLWQCITVLGVGRAWWAPGAWWVWAITPKFKTVGRCSFLFRMSSGKISGRRNHMAQVLIF